MKMPVYRREKTHRESKWRGVLGTAVHCVAAPSLFALRWLARWVDYVIPRGRTEENDLRRRPPQASHVPEPACRSWTRMSSMDRLKNTSGPVMYRKATECEQKGLPVEKACRFGTRMSSMDRLKNTSGPVMYRKATECEQKGPPVKTACRFGTRMSSMDRLKNTSGPVMYRKATECEQKGPPVKTVPGYVICVRKREKDDEKEQKKTAFAQFPGFLLCTRRRKKDDLKEQQKIAFAQERQKREMLASQKRKIQAQHIQKRLKLCDSLVTLIIFLFDKEIEDAERTMYKSCKG